MYLGRHRQVVLSSCAISNWNFPPMNVQVIKMHPLSHGLHKVNTVNIKDYVSHAWWLMARGVGNVGLSCKILLFKIISSAYSVNIMLKALSKHHRITTVSLTGTIFRVNSLLGIYYLDSFGSCLCYTLLSSIILIKMYCSN